MINPVKAPAASAKEGPNPASVPKQPETKKAAIPGQSKGIQVNEKTDKKPEEKPKLSPMPNNKVKSESKLKEEKPVIPFPAKKEMAAQGKEKNAGQGETAERAAEKKADEPELKERKAKLEKELREKFHIPKSEKAAEPWKAPEVEQVVRIPHNELHSFKDHPFNVEKNTKYMAFVASIRAHGVTQPAIVRPRPAGGYEIVSGHRRDEGGKDAGIPYTPCIIRALNDDQAIQQMVEDNVNNREIGTMELARALKKQLESLKHQGAQEALQGDVTASVEDVGKRSNAIVAERNGMSVKQVQRHIALTNLSPSLQEMVDGKRLGNDKTLKIAFTPAVELSYIKDAKLQEYIAVAIEGQQSTPSLSQAQRMRELAQKNILNPDMIDGIMLEEKKEVDKVIISSQELSQYFGKDKTPREMKDTILHLLDEWKDKQKDIVKPNKKNELEK
ncbi:ParB N-terminal domain-containing protein [Christensenella intestinihominis]